MRHAPMLPDARPVLVIHDAGRWYAATLLDAYRDAISWRAVVRYSTEPSFQYVRAVTYGERRPVVDAGLR